MNMYFLASVARESTEIYKDPWQVSRPFPKLSPRFSCNNDPVSKIFSLENDERSFAQILTEGRSTAEIFRALFSYIFSLSLLIFSVFIFSINTDTRTMK